MDGEASKEIMPRSTALLIGNAAYQSLTELPNPANDARDMARVLGACGFDTQICTDAAIADMDEAFEVFVDGIEEGDVALFFFAGHGVQIDGANYLMAVDTPSDRASRFLAVNRSRGRPREIKPSPSGAWRFPLGPRPRSRRNAPWPFRWSSVLRSPRRTGRAK